MATFRKRKGKWNVRIRSNHHRTISKTFIQKEDALKYARETESKIQRGVLEDLEQASQITVKQILQQYKAEETSKKRQGDRTASAPYTLIVVGGNDESV